MRLQAQKESRLEERQTQLLLGAREGNPGGCTIGSVAREPGLGAVHRATAQLLIDGCEPRAAQSLAMRHQLDLGFI